MGGCCTTPSKKDTLESDQETLLPPRQSQNLHNEVMKEGIAGDGGVWPFTEFFFSDLKTATKNFSSDEILSENGEESSNVVYKGRLQNNLGFIAIKKFNNTPWPDPDDFAEDAQRLGKLKNKRVVKLIGYCCDGDKRLLVSEFLPNNTLAKRLFHQNNQTMEWSMRLRVACCVAEALDYCRASGFASYSNLSAHTVLFNEDGDACLSCFGLINEIKGYRRRTGRVNSESVSYRFGIILLNLLSGKQISPSQALEMVNGKNFVELMDPTLEGKFSDEEATVVFQLAYRCLRFENVNTKHFVATVKALQTQTQVPSFDEGASSSQQQQLGTLQTKSQIPSVEMKKEASSSKLSPLAEACSKLDLNAIHEILVMTQYEDDKDISERSFEEWSPETAKLADTAFEKKDFEYAIHCYSKIIENRKVVFPSVYARRCLSYLFSNKIEAARRDMAQAHALYPEWPAAYYLMSVTLAKTDLTTESAYIFRQGTTLEEQKRQIESAMVV